MKFPVLSIALALLCGAAQAQNVEVKDAWIRTSVQGQMSTGAFMKITARENMTLVSASTPVAGVAEVHEMKMEGDVMKMRVVKGGLDLPVGKTVELAPGGYHLMMMDLKAALPKGSRVWIDPDPNSAFGTVLHPGLAAAVFTDLKSVSQVLQQSSRPQLPIPPTLPASCLAPICRISTFNLNSEAYILISSRKSTRPSAI